MGLLLVLIFGVFCIILVMVCDWYLLCWLVVVYFRFKVFFCVELVVGVVVVVLVVIVDICGVIGFLFFGVLVYYVIVNVFVLILGFDEGWFCCLILLVGLIGCVVLVFVLLFFLVVVGVVVFGVGVVVYGVCCIIIC